jgi:hypothetical protein
LIGAINTRTFGRWAAHLRDRIAVPVDGDGGFARAHPQ